MLSWTRVPITRIEDLSDAVYGAGLRAVQMSRAPISGSLLFADHDGVVFSSGRIDGRVELIGPLSQSMVTLGLGVDLAPGTRHWMREVGSGDMGLFMPGDEHDALYFPGSIYAAVTLSAERAEEIGARMGRVIDLRKLGGTSVLPAHADPAELHRVRSGFRSLHATGVDSMHVADALVSVLMAHTGRLPRPSKAPANYRGRSIVVRRSREYITANLHGNLSMEVLAKAADTSARTLFRAFTEALDETPLHYIRRLRLHRIREELLGDVLAERPVTIVANRWGITELGRFAGWYRELFGELPSQTASRTRGERVVGTLRPKLARSA